MFGRHGFGGPGPFGGFRGRIFERGDLKYVILDLLQERPRHGYDIIRALEEQFGGFYSPSPGAVYPTLQMLEDLGHVTAVQQDGKKVYTITDEGRAFLGERGQVMDDIRERMGRWWGGPRAGAEWHELKHELKDLGRTLRERARGGSPTPEQVGRIREVVRRAAREIEDILRGEGVSHV